MLNKFLKNIGLKGRQIISLFGGSTRLGPALLKIAGIKLEIRSRGLGCPDSQCWSRELLLAVSYCIREHVPLSCSIMSLLLWEVPRHYTSDPQGRVMR
jgi:hypothetical protein